MQKNFSLFESESLHLCSLYKCIYTTLSKPGYTLGSDTLIVGNNLLPFSVEQLPIADTSLKSRYDNTKQMINPYKDFLTDIQRILLNMEHWNMA